MSGRRPGPRAVPCRGRPSWCPALRCVGLGGSGPHAAWSARARGPSACFPPSGVRSERPPGSRAVQSGGLAVRMPANSLAGGTRSASVAPAPDLSRSAPSPSSQLPAVPLHGRPRCAPARADKPACRSCGAMRGTNVWCTTQNGPLAARPPRRCSERWPRPASPGRSTGQRPGSFWVSRSAILLSAERGGVGRRRGYVGSV